jgi:hypothetical protein
MLVSRMLVSRMLVSRMLVSRMLVSRMLVGQIKKAQLYILSCAFSYFYVCTCRYLKIPLLFI